MLVLIHTSFLWCILLINSCSCKVVVHECNIVPCFQTRSHWILASDREDVQTTLCSLFHRTFEYQVEVHTCVVITSYPFLTRSFFLFWFWRPCGELQYWNSVTLHTYSTGTRACHSCKGRNIEAVHCGYDRDTLIFFGLIFSDKYPTEGRRITMQPIMSSVGAPVLLVLIFTIVFLV